MFGITVGDPDAAFVQVSVERYWAIALPLPLAMLWFSVSGIAAVLDSAAAVKGPCPVPLDVPDAKAAPPLVALIEKLN